MTETDETIRVEALGSTRTFEGRAELAEHVKSFLDNRMYDPLEQACIQRLAQLSNGDSPPEVERVARRIAFHGPSRDVEAERRQSPLGDRLGELEEGLAERQEDHGEAQSAYFGLKRELNAKRRRGESVSTAERDHLRELKRDMDDARRALTRAKAALGKAKRAADRWRESQRNRWVVGPSGDRRVVNAEELHRWIDERR